MPITSALSSSLQLGSQEMTSNQRFLPHMHACGCCLRFRVGHMVLQLNPDSLAGRTALGSGTDTTTYLLSQAGRM